MSDPYFTSVALLLPFDGSDGATSTTDASPYAHTITFNGGAQLDTARSKWGASSLYLDGNGDYLSVPDSTAWDFGDATTGAFTVEFWVYFDGTQTAVNTYEGGLIARHTTGDSTIRWYVARYKDDYPGPEAGKLRVSNNAGNVSSATGSTVVTVDAWHHIALSGSAGTWKLFLDGTQDASGTFTSFGTSTLQLRIGRLVNEYSKCWLDDIRITKGVNRYTANFTPPSEAFPTSGTISTYISEDGGVLGAPAFLGSGTLRTMVAASSPLGAALVLGYNDPTPGLAPGPITWAMDLVTPSGSVRVPISSWQATLASEQQSYGQCVIPACGDWIDDINAATEFDIWRIGKTRGGDDFEALFLTVPIDTVQLAHGPTNYSATLSGYFDAYAVPADPDTINDRTLQGVQTVFSGSSELRLRCSIDWLLRPGQRAYYDATPIVVGWISYYVPSSGAQYMDLGQAEA